MRSGSDSGKGLKRHTAEKGAEGDGVPSGGGWGQPLRPGVFEQRDLKEEHLARGDSLCKGPGVGTCLTRRGTREGLGAGAECCG